MKRMALGLASAASTFWGFLWFLGAFAEGGRWLGIGVLLMALATLYAWRRPRPGGWVLLGEGWFLAASLAGLRPLLVFALTALPYLLAGGYLVISLRKEEEP
ncbi:hypothetical protein [Thermus tengchongensis]|uniref:Uncharacterized protein n=1 Tax=Thermus tengchongensis TaxID=1214928 RepID=A0A4Y9F9B0_9DEIN|nr:hypothetical protein [Thermus tengchongensis]TFU25736.1 hypothetical protein E0687_09120 [Thermus tengchongensis]